MISKIAALLLALVVFWSGSLGQEQPVAIATASAEEVDARMPGEPSKWLPAGLADLHPAEELSAQGHTEAAADLQAILADGIQLRTPVLAMAQPDPYAGLERLSPYLDGPQRPPCVHTFTA